MAKYNRNELAIAIRRWVYEGQADDEEVLMAVLSESTKVGLERAIDKIKPHDVALADFVENPDDYEDQD